jgi:uncharacterized protein (DUF302 family)
LGATGFNVVSFIKQERSFLEASMTEAAEQVPFGAYSTEGMVHRRSPFSVADTVGRLTAAIDAAGAKLFVVVDHSGEAERVGGTPAMQSSPGTALDLPLKILVWADDDGAVWMTYLSAEWLAKRHGIPADQAKPLGAVEALTTKVAASG